MKINYNSSPLSTSSNNIIPSSPSFNIEQLDQLSNQLRMLNIDDESINKVLEQLKTIKNEVFDNEDIVEQTDLLDFVLSKFRPPKNKIIVNNQRMSNSVTNNQIINNFQKMYLSNSELIKKNQIAMTKINITQENYKELKQENFLLRQQNCYILVQIQNFMRNIQADNIPFFELEIQQ